MKFILILTFVFAGLAGAVNAQLCGKYSTTLIVTDTKGVPIRNSGINVVALQNGDYAKIKSFVWQKDDLSNYTISFNEGYKVNGNYKITISAKGYLPEEKEISFPHCVKQRFEFRLKSENAPQYTNLSGKVIDSAGAVIPETKVVLTNAKGEKIETYTNEDGIYTTDVEPGIFSVEFEVRGFLTVKVENYQLAPTKMTLDVVLEVDMESKTTIYSEMICEASKVKKDEQECKYVSRLGNGMGKPVNLTFQTVKKTNNKFIKRKNNK